MSGTYFQHVAPEELTCGAGCRCTRNSWYNTIEAAFRREVILDCDVIADELLLRRYQHKFDPVRINRAGRCIQDWKGVLEAEKHWLRLYESAIEQGKHVAKVQEDAEREKSKAEQLERAAAKEADRERRKSRFMGSFNDLKWL